MLHIEEFDKEAHLDWIVVNDGVMGGVSRSRIEVLDDGTARFSGTISLENNGGFASTRAALEQPIPAAVSKIAIRTKGDGKRYSFRIRTSGSFSRVSYKMDFDTQKGEWTTHAFDLADFIPTFRGRTLEGVPPVGAAGIREVGFLIADKQEGGFVLFVDWIRGLK
ncbi:MAG: CIA30 family protein [Phaeodactylibacter sp.]|nr:CIA30 family protein [Phaeodactylibacter sp.]